MATQSAFAKSYNSFSGVDIKAVFNTKVVGELQAVSYSIQREKAPLYTMGAADPRSFSRGKRGIAGTLIFLMFDRHVLLGHFGLFATDPLNFQADKDDARPVANASGGTDPLSLVTLNGAATPLAGAEQSPERAINNVGDDQEVTAPWYVDQIPPFDITLAAANEYGALAVMAIVGVEILNEGYGVSIDDIVSEMQNTYAARAIAPWRSVGVTAGTPAYQAAPGGVSGTG
jgi:hypothetical protein